MATVQKENFEDNTEEEEAYVKYEKKSKWQGFSEFVYDKKAGKVLGRTPTSWFQIIVFYLCFYAFLAGFFAVCLAVFLETLNNDYPKYFGKGSILGNNPGMGFQPWLHDDPESTLIYINKSEPKSFKKYVDQIERFLIKYDNTSFTRDCQGSASNGDVKVEESCKFDISAYNQTGDDPEAEDACTVANHFGYATGKPCVILTLNRLIGWRPVAYPQDSVPDSIKGRYQLTDDFAPVAFECVGEFAPDHDNIGKVQYIPETGIHGRFYPYRKMKNYHQPFAFVKFNNLPIGTLVEVECHALAYNIVQDQSDRLGMVHFELLIDEKPKK